MLNNTLVISNNKLVKENLSRDVEVLYVEGTFLQTLEKTRDFIHKGCILLTHPLSGSIKPNETPYKSIAIEKRQGPVDLDSLRVIEKSIIKTISLLKDKDIPPWPEDCLEDFREIDLDLIRNALKL